MDSTKTQMPTSLMASDRTSEREPRSIPKPERHTTTWIIWPDGSESMYF